MCPGHADLLTVVVESHGSKRIVRAAGELDLSTAGQLDEALRAREHGSEQVVLELQELTFIDASGLSVIARASHDLGDRFSLASASRFVRRVLAITGLDQELQIVGNAEGGDAVESNVDYVRRLWEAWAADLGAFVELVPDGVEWRPWQGRRAVLHGVGDLIEFSRSPGIRPVRATSFTPVGDDVLVRLELALTDGTSKEIWSLCQFNGSTLTRAMNFDSRAKALAHAA